MSPVAGVRVVVFGASGYAGLDLLRALGRHPAVAAVVSASERHAGRPIESLAPGLVGTFATNEAALAGIERGAIAFLATPAEASLHLAREALERGARVIDLSGAFRLRDARLYPRWYGFEHPAPEWLDEAAYGLPELFAYDPGVRLVANPGCYATAATLSLAPLVAHGFHAAGPIPIDGKSGTTGAGRRADEPYSHAEVDDGIRPYRVVGHQHVPEIEQALDLGGEGRPHAGILLTPHLIPIRRGLLTTAYARLQPGVTEATVAKAYEEFYAKTPFVRFRGDEPPDPRRLLHTNQVEVGLRVDPRTGLAVLMAALDNLGKGAALQAIQNLNRLLGLDDRAGLLGG